MKTLLIVLLAALCGCIASEDTMPGQSKETLYDSLTGIRVVLDSNGTVVKSNDGKGIFKLKPGTGIELGFSPTDEAYEVSQAVGGAVAVPSTRSITVGSPLEINGGGSATLANNLTITMPNPISDAQHGARGNGSLHALADAFNPGFMPEEHFSHVSQQLATQGPFVADALIDCSVGRLIKVDCTAGNVIITLNVATFANGRRITIKRIVDPVAGGCEIRRSDGGQFEDGSTSIFLTAAFAAITLETEVNLAWIDPYRAWRVGKW